jgi:hypothetical protein
MWAPPVGDHMREREGSGRWRACCGLKVGMGRGEGWWVGFVFFFFVFFFKTFLTQTFEPFRIQIFTQLFTNFFTIIFKTFHKYFKTFKTTPQPKLMHFNMMHKHLGDSNY